jgi:chromosome segregation ATPase
LKRIRDYWQKALGRLGGQFNLPRARVLQRRLGEVREDNRRLHLELEAVQDALEASGDRQVQALADLQELVERLQQQHRDAECQVEMLQESLDRSAARQESTERRVAELDDVLQETHDTHQAELQAARLELKSQRRRSNGALLVAGLAVLLVALAALTATRDIRDNSRVLGEISRDLQDIKSAMEQQQADGPPAAGSRDMPGLGGTPGSTVGGNAAVAVE